MSNNKEQLDKALIKAIKSRNEEEVELLVKQGADVDVRFDGNVTPLIFFAKGGNVKICEFLLGEGADVNTQTPCGKTPLYFAACGGHLELCRLLLAKGADVQGLEKEIVDFTDQDFSSELFIMMLQKISAQKFVDNFAANGELVQKIFNQDFFKTTLQLIYEKQKEFENQIIGERFFAEKMEVIIQSAALFKAKSELKSIMELLGSSIEEESIMDEDLNSSLMCNEVLSGGSSIDESSKPATDTEQISYCLEVVGSRESINNLFMD